MNNTETFYLIEVPGGDRRYINRSMTPERYEHFKKQTPGTRIFKVVVKIPMPKGKTFDKEVKAEASVVHGVDQAAVAHLNRFLT